MRGKIGVATVVGETTITGKNQVSLPAKSIKALGWERGDHLIVEVLDDMMLVLIRRPTNWDALAGHLDHVFGTPEETGRWLNEERDSWEKETSGGDSRS